MNRRDFLKTAGAGGVLPVVTPALSGGPQPRSAQQDDRAIWVSLLRKIADPVLKNLAAGTLKARMPVEQHAGGNRQTVTHLEAIGRLIAGIAPWLELPADTPPKRAPKQG